MRKTAILLAPLVVAACTTSRVKSHQQTQDSGQAKQYATVALSQKEDGAFSRPREFFISTPKWCRNATAYYIRGDGKYEKVARKWLIEPMDAEVIASQQYKHYEVSRPYQNEQVTVSPGASIEALDRFTLTYKDDRLLLFHERGAPGNSVYVGWAELTLRPYDPPHLWAEGDAFAAVDGTIKRLGVYRVYRRPDEGACRHSSYSDMNTKPWCRSALIEFYDENDMISATHAPIKGLNVYQVDNPELCEENTRETSDGEGDEGPNKN